MVAYRSLAVFFLSLVIGTVVASHFRGGIIQWRPDDPDDFNGSIIITHRIAWRRSWEGNDLYCEDSDITAKTLFHEGSDLVCSSGCVGTVGPLDFFCTDFSTVEDWVSGEKSFVYVPDPTLKAFEAVNSGLAWIGLVVGGGGWDVKVKFNLTMRPDGKINSSPMSAITPIVRLQHGCEHVIRIPVGDADGDILRCRWASESLGECGGICNAFPNTVLDMDSCTISYNASGALGWYAVAIQIEDFLSPSSQSPLSSVPLQFLVRVFSIAEPCSAQPILVPEETPPDGSCISVEFGTTYTTGIVAASGNLSIIEFPTISPIGLMTSGITQSMYNSSLYYVNVTWTPTLEQFGLNIFCFSATNSRRVTSSQWCIKLLGGVQGPRIIPSSITPTGILSPSSATLWSATYDQPIRRPRSSRFIEVYRANDDHLVHRIDVTSPDVAFPLSGSNRRTVTFKFDFSFVIGTRYYLLFQGGAVVGDIFCNQESHPITDKTFWTFTVSDLQQQSSDTCAALDTLIANRNVDITGICSRNHLCTAVSCFNKPSLSTTINTEITFSPCNYPISVHHFVVRTVHGFDPHAIIDEISTGNQTIQLQLFPGTINNLFSQEIIGVNYGLTESSPVEGGNEQTTTIFQPIDIPLMCPIGCPLETDPLWQILWPNTPPYVNRIQRCPEERNWFGNVSRYCNGNGVWSDPDVLSCTSIEFATILAEALEAFSSYNSSELLNQTANVTSRLAEATSGHEISLLPSDLQTTNNLLNRVINILEDNTDSIQQSPETGPDENDVISIFNNVLDENNTAGWMNLQNVVTVNGSELLLNNAERYGLVLARAVEAPRRLSRPNIALSASQFDTFSPVTDEDLSFPSSEDLVNYTSEITSILASIPTDLITEKLSNSSSVPVVHILFNNLEDFLPPSSLDSSEAPDGTSAIYSLQIGEREDQSRILLDTPIDLEFTFSNFENALNYKCAFWNFSKPIGSGGFSTDGVVTASINIGDDVTTVQCLSNHTTSFAVLVDVAGGLQTAPEGELKALQAVSYVGCSISIICLSLTVLFFLTQRKKLFQSVNFFVHLNLAATLLVAFVVFVFGIELGKITTGGCLFVALLLHYLFLSAFCWMLCEGILLYLLLVVVFSKIPSQRWLFILIGYVSPIPIVVISVSARHDYYGVRNSEGILQYCWLSVEKGTIYAFVVPMLLIIIINVVFLVLSLNSLFKSKKKRYSINKTDKNSNFAIAKSLFIASVILLPLLGLTWIFGILTINSNSTVFAWFFTLFNSVQGAAIFFFHVIRNEMVWSKISPRLSVISSKVFGIAGDTKLHISEFSSVTRNSRYASRRGDRGSTFSKGGTVLKVKPTDSNESEEVNKSPIFEETKLDLGKKPDETANDNEDIKIEESEKQAKESAEQDMSTNLQDKDDNVVSEGTILEETIEIMAYRSQENVENYDDKVDVDQKIESEKVEEIQAVVESMSVEGNSTIDPAVSNIKDINPTSEDSDVEGTNIEELENKGENNVEVIKSNNSEALDDR